jgi:two-component system CheB/CheR fusion protein
MPKSAAATGTVDFILSPEMISAELMRISRHPCATLPATDKAISFLPNGEDALNNIFAMLLAATGVDFTCYKRTTIQRRILRRMLLQKTDAIDQYARYLKENPTEVKTLYQDILINVTSFFRDPETFTVLTNTVIPRIFENRPSGAPIRVWVPGCSTGEEAYSLAMCLLEFCSERGIGSPFQIFGSDIDEAAVEIARRGLSRHYHEDVAPGG